MTLTWTAAFIMVVCSLVSCDALTPRRFKAWRDVLPDKLVAKMDPELRAMNQWEAGLSTLKDEKRRTRWFRAGKRPRLAAEEAIARLEKFVRPGRDGKGYAGAEWWVQIVNAGPSGKLGFHLDKDESVASNKRYLVHPEWSSVYYLTAAGGCTLIFDQHSPNGNGYEPELPEEGELVCPEANKYVIFNGTLLHGVIPGRTDHLSEAERLGMAPAKGERVTFLVNWWAHKPEGPNCEELPYEQVPGLKTMSRDDLRKLRDELDKDTEDDDEDDARKRHAIKPKLFDMRKGVDKHETYMLEITHPGGDRAMVELPSHFKRGGTYKLRWRDPPGKRRKRKSSKASKKKKKNKNKKNRKGKKRKNKKQKRQHDDL